MKYEGRVSIDRFFKHRDKPALPISGERFSVRSTGGKLEAVARLTFEKLACVLERMTSEDRVVLTTVEDEMEAGGFPTFLERWFADSEWSPENRYYIPTLRKDRADDSIYVNHLTSEADPSVLRRVMCPGDGVLWKTNLAIGGVVVPSRRVGDCLDKNPFIYEQLSELAPAVQTAFVLDHDLIFLDVLVVSEAGTELREWLSTAWDEAT